MRILILNQPFHPDVVATAQIAKDLADELVARGHDVTAIASRSIYGQRGAVLARREVVDGIDVIRVGSNVFGKGSTVGRLVDFAMYYTMALGHGLFRKRFDVAVCLTTPPFVATVGVLLGALRGTRTLLWTMDIYPDVMVAHGMIRERGVVDRLLRRLHGVVLRRVDRTVALGRCMRERLIAQGGPAERTEVIAPWSPAERAPRSGEDHGAGGTTVDGASEFRARWGVGDRLLVMYSGNFGLAHDVRTFLEAAERLKGDDRVRFAFLGGGKRWGEVESFVKERGLANCVLDAYQPRDKLAALLAAADVHLVSMISSWSGLVVPSKFYGVMAAGRAAVFVGPASSEIARVIDETGCGARVEPGDSAELAALLLRLAGSAPERQAMARAGLRAAGGPLGGASGCAQLASIVESLARHRPAGEMGAGVPGPAGPGAPCGR